MIYKDDDSGNLNLTAILISKLDGLESSNKKILYRLEKIENDCGYIKESIKSIDTKNESNEKAIIRLNEVSIPCVEHGIKLIKDMFEPQQVEEGIKLTPIQILFQKVEKLQFRYTFTWWVSIFTFFFVFLQGERLLSMKTDEILELLKF
tara:strand:+ start:425 stop:871 length:447 start_codon:yes stop_codon:yes gene_type:complete